MTLTKCGWVIHYVYSGGDSIVWGEVLSALVLFCFSFLDSSLAGLQDRFSAMATKLELKYDEQYSTASKLTSLFLMCDAYYVEICCQDNGYVASVKLAQASTQVKRITWCGGVLEGGGDDG